MSVHPCSRQKQIWPRFFDAIFLPAKSTRFWSVEGSFSTPESSVLFHSWAQRFYGRYIWFQHADLFLGVPRLPPKVVSACLNFFCMRNEKFAFTRQKSSGPSPILLLLYIELAISFLIGRKRTVNFRNQRLWRRNCRLYNNHVKVKSNHVKVTGNHVMYDRGAWFLRVIMSSSRALCYLALAKKQNNDFNFFSFNV